MDNFNIYHEPLWNESVGMINSHRFIKKYQDVKVSKELIRYPINQLSFAQDGIDLQDTIPTQWSHR